jgi:hypothetical protein
MAVTHRSIGVVVESSFGSLDSATGLPDQTLVYTSMPVERDPVVIYGDVIASERSDTRDGPYGMPPEPDTVYSGGSRVQRRTGSVELRLDLTTVGAGVNDYDSNYLGQLLGGGFLTAKHSVTTDTASVASDANTFTPTTTSTNYAIGNLVGVEYQGRAEYSAVTDNNESGDITISPAVSATAALSSATVRMLQTWYPSRTGTTTHSLSFRVDGVNFRTFVFGAVLESISISLDNGRLMADLVYQAACIQDNHTGAGGPVEPLYNSGAPAFFRGAYVVVSSTAPTSTTDASTGDTLARTALDCESFTFTVTNTLTPKGRSNSILAMSGMDVSDVAVECSLTLSTVTTALDSDYFNRQLRQVLIGTGPVGNGLGCALMIPAGYLTTDPSKYDVSGNDIVRQTLNYAQSRFGGDVVSTGAGNSPVRIGLTVGS